ncbi:MAG: NADH-quinone oxidoreductase subunit J family protein [Myxococcaceae bacterium]
MTTVLFYAFAILTVVAAAGVIAARSPIYSAMSLVGTFFCLAGIYVLLLAHTIAVLQVLVYAGAIMVLFLFVIMLLSLGDVVSPSKITIPRVIGGLSAAGLFVALVIATRPYNPANASTPPSFGTLQSIGAQLYTQWLAPFEAVSLLLLVAMVGAVVVAKSRV